MNFNLERFIEAQDNNKSFANALQEIEQGEKISHWMWYVFPQIKGLGRSAMAKKYAISSLYEAYAFMNNALTRDRLWEATRVMNDMNDGRDIVRVLGSVDAMKFKSCMTLFDIIEPHAEFERALDIFFYGERDQLTLEIVAEERKEFHAHEYRDCGYNGPIKALFDGGSHEGNEFGSAKRIATFLDFRKRGYSIAIMSRNYLISHNDLFDNYRTVNLEHTLMYLGLDFIDAAVQYCYDTENMPKARQLTDIFPDTYFLSDDYADWETFAFRLDLLFGFCISDKILSKMVDNIIASDSVLNKA